MDKMNLSDYVTKDKYEGCDPVIAEALKQGKHIKVQSNKTGREYFVTDFIADVTPYLVVSVEGKHQDWLSEVTPIKQKKKVKYVKPFSEIMKWFESVGYTIETGYIKSARKDLGGTGVFNFEMIQYCGQKPNDQWNWREEWLEEREE